MQTRSDRLNEDVLRLNAECKLHALHSRCTNDINIITRAVAYPQVSINRIITWSRLTGVYIIPIPSNSIKRTVTDNVRNSFEHCGRLVAILLANINKVFVNNCVSRIQFKENEERNYRKLIFLLFF